MSGAEAVSGYAGFGGAQPHADVNTALGEAADNLARVVSGMYASTVRFTERGARSAHPRGGASAPSAYARLQEHLAAVKAASGDGVRDAIRSERQASRALRASAAYPAGRSAFADMRGPGKVSSEANGIARFARGLLASRKTAPSGGGAQASSSLFAPAPDGMDGGFMASDSVVTDVPAAREQIRRRAGAVGLGALTGAKMSADIQASGTARILRFFTRGARTVSTGVMDTARHVCATPHGRLTALVAASVAFVGYGCMGYLPFGPEHIHGATALAADGTQSAWHALGVYSSELVELTGRAAVAIHTNFDAFKDSLTSASGNLLAQASSLLGHSPAGQEIVQAAAAVADGGQHAFSSAPLDFSHMTASAGLAADPMQLAAPAQLLDPGRLVDFAQPAAAPGAARAIAGHAHQLASVATGAHQVASHAAHAAASGPSVIDQLVSANMRIIRGAVAGDSTPMNFMAHGLGGADVLNGMELAYKHPGLQMAAASTDFMVTVHAQLGHHAASLHAAACSHAHGMACTVHTAVQGGSVQSGGGAHTLFDAHGRVIAHHAVPVSLPAQPPPVTRDTFWSESLKMYLCLATE